MKKLICLLLLSATLLSSLTSCANNGDNSGDGTQNAEGTSEPAAKVVEPLAHSLQEIGDLVSQPVPDELPLVTAEAEDAERFAYYFNTERAEEIKEVLIVEPNNGSVPFMIGLLRVKEGTTQAKLEELAENLEKSVNPGRWVCVTASVVEAVTNGDVILLLLENDGPRAQEIIDAFKAI